MSVWRYTAVELASPRRDRRRGELSGGSAAEVRASLRRIGLQVVELHPVAAAGSARRLCARHLRRRRRERRAELYDSLATMLDSGVPLLETLDTVITSTGRRRSSLRLMLVALRQELRSGSSLAQAMALHTAWFETAEVAMVEAGQHGGTLPEVLRTLSQRHERSGELSQRLIGALAYPAIVTLVGLAVVIFLSVRTLPSLAGVLQDAGIEVPALTLRVMALGQTLAAWWPALLVGLLVAVVSAPMLSRVLSRKVPRVVRLLSPPVLRRIAVARFSIQLAELLRSGVPVVEALRVLAPTAASWGGDLRARLTEAADAVERGKDLSAALADEHWFDPEFRRLLEIGQVAGNLDDMLERLGQRYTRAADRLIDRLATLLEPCVILALAVLVGIVVMAAILPLLRLQEIL